MGDGLSAAVRRNLIAMQKLTDDIGRVQQRLATGRKVNSPERQSGRLFHRVGAQCARGRAQHRHRRHRQRQEDAGSRERRYRRHAGADRERALVAYQALNSSSTLAKVNGRRHRAHRRDLAIASLTTATPSRSTTARCTATYTHATGQDVQDFLDAVNNHANLEVEASLTSDGRIHLEATGVNDITIARLSLRRRAALPSGSPPAPPQAPPMRSSVAGAAIRFDAQSDRQPRARRELQWPEPARRLDDDRHASMRTAAPR